MARAVSKKALMRFEGMDTVIAKMEKIIANTSGGTQGAKLKRVYVEAAAIVSNQARANIASLPNTSAELKEVLSAMVVTNEGPESKPNAISAVVQQVGVKKFPDRFVPNPYWFEYGTVARTTKKGANRGQIQPTPFFRPAIATARGKATEVLVDGLKKLVDL